MPARTRHNKHRFSSLFWLVVLCGCIPQPARAHLGPHASAECFIDIEDMRLRFNAYQFHGKHPEKPYCRYFPELGDIIINIDSLQELNDQGISLAWLEVQPFSQIMSGHDLLQTSHETDWQRFSKPPHSLRTQVDRRGLYGIQIRLRDGNGTIRQTHFYFLVGIPVVLILVCLSGLLLLLIGFLFVRTLRK